MQTLARKIEAHRGFVIQKIDIDPNIRLLHVHRRALTRIASKLIDDGVFDFQRTELGMRDLRIRRRKIHRQRLLVAHVLRPTDGLHTAIEFLGRRRRKRFQWEQNSVRDSRPETGAVSRFQIALEIGAGTGFFDPLGTLGTKLLNEEILHPFGSSGEKTRHGGWVAQKIPYFYKYIR